jgi:hypothetical protein
LLILKARHVQYREIVWSETMGLQAWLDLQPADVVAFLIVDILGYLVGSLAPPGARAVLTSVLVSYHLFLAWLVFNSDRKATVALPIVPTLFTHLSCLAVIVPLGVTSQVIPALGLFRFLIAAFAVFERGWLFSGNTVESEPEKVIEAPVITSTAEDFAAWTHYLAQRKPGSGPQGVSIKAEYEQWLRARHASKAAQRPTHPR